MEVPDPPPPPRTVHGTQAGWFSYSAYMARMKRVRRRAQTFFRQDIPSTRQVEHMLDIVAKEEADALLEPAPTIEPDRPHWH